MDVLKEYDETVKPLRKVVGAAMTVFNEWGAGLLESAYEAGIKHLLEKIKMATAMVTTPMPPTWIKNRMTNCPKTDQ